MTSDSRQLHKTLDSLGDIHGFPRPRPLEPARQIYVNRDLRMDQIELVGFDMDYTVARYAKLHIEELAFRLTAERLVADRGHPRALLETTYDPALCIRGLVIDKRQGTVLKMDRYRHVGRGHRGYGALTKEERRSLYRSMRIRTGLSRYHLIDTLFGLPEVALFIELVEMRERTGHPAVSYEQIFDDIRECIDAIHRDGTLKSIIRADLDRYVDPDPELPHALHRFRSSGKRLFLLTNSMWPYTDLVMEHVLGGRLLPYPTWRHYFDIVLVGAGKPGFFTEREPFRVINDQGQPGKVVRGQFERNKVYHGGNLADFESLAGVGGDKVLYVGDHIYGDMLRSKKNSAWRTAMVIEELEQEIHHLQGHREDFARIRKLEQTCSKLDIELNYLAAVNKSVQRATPQNGWGGDGSQSETDRARREIRAELEDTRQQLRASLAELQNLEDALDAEANPNWGLLFREGLEASRFADQVEDYACVYTGRVSNFLFYSPKQYFRSVRDRLPHEWV